jgi:hypothetical protein
MNMQQLLRPVLLLSCTTLLALACSGETSSAAAPPEPSAAVKSFVLATDPGDAVGVVASKKAEGGKDVVVEGRIHEVTSGFAIFKLMDGAMPYCGETDPSDKCDTPWDYCCETKEDRKAQSLLVEMRDAEGRPLATPSLPDLRPCDLVKVRGAIEKDEHGNQVLVASGVFLADRPELPDYVKWPQ